MGARSAAAPLPVGLTGTGRRAAWTAASVVLAAVVLRLLWGPATVTLDSAWTLVWGRDVVAGDQLTPSPTTTAHVLGTLIGTVLAPLGATADRVLAAVVFLSAGAIIVASAQMAWALAGRAAAAAAALLLLLSEQLLYATRAAALDVVWTSLVVCALLVMVRGRPHTWRVAGILLALAALQRPEPWLLLVGLGIVEWRRRSGRPDLLLVALAALVPPTWALVDLVLTGDPLASLHQTQDAVGRLREAVPGPGGRVVDTASTLARALGPALILGLLGSAVLWMRGRWPAGARRGTRLLVGAGAVLAAAIVAEGLVGTLLFARFALPLTAIGAVLTGCAVAAVAELAPSRGSRAAGAGLAAALLLTQLGLVALARGRMDREVDAARSLRQLVTAGVPCAPLRVTTASVQPQVAVWGDLRGSAVPVVEPPAAGAPGAWILARVDPRTGRGEGLAFDGTSYEPRPVPPGREPGTLIRVSGDGRWAMREACRG